MTIRAKLFLSRTHIIRGNITQKIYRTKFKRDHNRYNRFVTSKTQLCIEGFPRSANSFAFNAISQANRELLHIARHIHTLGQINEAVTGGIPTLLVIREPRGTIASLIKGYSSEDLALLLRAFILYYEGVLPWCRELVVSDFETTTLRIDQTVGALNRRYGLHLRPPTNEDESNAKDFLLNFGERGDGEKGLAPYRNFEKSKLNLSNLEPALLKRADKAYMAVKEYSV